MSVAARLEGLLGNAPPAAVGGASVVIVGLLGLADVATGSELSSSVFYALPVGLAAWYAGWRWGMGVGLLAAGTWYQADVWAGAMYSAPWIAAWNTGVRLAFFLIIAGLLVRLRRALEAQRALAEVDSLTGLANTRRFLGAVQGEVARAARYRRALSLAYLDLDGFKGVNDRWGHAVGDDVLETVGRVLRDQLRASDLPARLGGDEFAVLFPETDGPAVHEAAEKLRAVLEAAMSDKGWPVGFSMGVVTSTGDVTDPDELIRLADELMYQVKGSGKGRTTYRVTPALEGGA